MSRRDEEVDDDFADRAARIYYDDEHPAAYGGVARLAKALKDRGGKKTRAWLRSQDPYTLHRPRRLRWPRRPTIVRGPGVQLQADLMDVSSHARGNDGVRFLLTVVDAFSRKAWVTPLRGKGAEGVASALDRILKG